MDNNLVYVPTFRSRQQENLVLKSFDFEENIYPLVEIIKKHDRARKEDIQKTFEDIYIELITSINAQRVFVDLPVYLKVSGAMKNEVIEFSREVLDHVEVRCEHINRLSGLGAKVIPVISSFLIKTGEQGTIETQWNLLNENFDSIAFRLFPSTFAYDFPIVSKLARERDYILMDLEQIIPYHKSPPLRSIVTTLTEYKTCCKVLLRSAINGEIQNVNLDHGQVVFDADNSQIDEDVMKSFGVNATGDYSGVKKDDLTAGGSISPGFIYYNAVENQYYGFKAKVKKSIEEFEKTIVPDVLACPSTAQMLQSAPVFLTDENQGYATLLSISQGKESGKSQAKFKKIAMDHYLFCIREKIRSGLLTHQP